MGREYDIENNSTVRLKLSYGNLPVRGTLVRHETLAVGSDLQVTLQSALGEGEWDGIDSLGYNGAIISSQYYSFHAGGNGDIAADSFFPNDVNHEGAAFINVRLPVGMATDNDPDKLVGNYRCLKVNDYDANGNIIGYNFSRNPARIAADVIKRKRPRLLARIEWTSWTEWRDWCDTIIQTVKDGVSVNIPRFELNFPIELSIDLAEIIDLICQLSCTDNQWRGGFLRFMPPVDRPTENFTFDLSQVSANDYSFIPTDRRSRPNMIIVNWRNFDDEFYKDEDPIIIKRDDLITRDGQENSLQINAGICRKNQAERTGHFWAKTRCDATEYSAVLGSWKSYPMLPADVVKLTHDIPGYTQRRFKIIEKSEDESNGTGYQHKLQDIPANAYSDTDQTPLVLHPAIIGPNPFSAPPVCTLALTQDSGLAADGSTFRSVKGAVVFGSFGFAQKAKVYWLKPDGSYEFYRDLTPDAAGSASFEALNPPDGTNWFKVVTFSQLNVANSGVSIQNEKSINVSASTFYVDGFPVSVGLFRALTGLNPNGKYIGRDTEVVPVSAIECRIDSAEIVGENVWCVIAVTLKDLIGQHNQADSANTVQVDVFDQFGNLVKSFPPAAVSLKSATAVMSFPRKYADPKEGQAYFRIKVINNFGWSNVVYLQGNAFSTAIPTAKVSANCPRELTASPVSSTVAQITFQFSGSCNLYRRAPGAANWIQHVTGIGGSPFNATGLSESTDYEFQLRSSANESNRSNIVRVRTKQQGEPAPLRPAPTSLSGSPDPGNPTTQINTSWVRNAVDNIAVEVWKDGNLSDTIAADQQYYNFGGLGAGSAHTFKTRNKWGTGDYSAFSNELSISTQNPPPAAAAPEITSASYDVTNQQANAYFTPHGGGGTYQTEYRIDGGAWNVQDYGLSAGANQFDIPILQNYTADQNAGLRIRRNDVAGYSNEFAVTVPIRQMSGGGGVGGGGCFTGSTLFNLSLNESIQFAELFKRRAEFIGRRTLSFDADNNHTSRRILHIFRVRSNKFILAEFANGKKIKCTPTHRFWTANREFISICDLKAGDKVYDKNWDLVEITSIKLKTVKNQQWFYNATIEVDHAYFIDFAVSNNKPLPGDE